MSTRPGQPSSTAPSPRSTYPVCIESLPNVTYPTGRYTLTFARTPEDLDAILKLRFEVFNLEMGEGLDASFETRRDEDEFDLVCHHLMVKEEDTGQIIGTYRMQTQEMAAQRLGFYSSSEFDLSALQNGFLNRAVELGRACISKDHRNGLVLFLLWKGLAKYMIDNDKRYFFGCCSLTSQDENEGRAVMNYLEEGGYIDPEWKVQPQPGFACFDGNDAVVVEDIKIPKLMRMYLQYGARICGPPAVDRLFKTIDFLASFDLENLTPRAKKVFQEVL